MILNIQGSVSLLYWLMFVITKSSVSLYGKIKMLIDSKSKHKEV